LALAPLREIRKTNLLCALAPLRETRKTNDQRPLMAAHHNGLPEKTPGNGDIVQPCVSKMDISEKVYLKYTLKLFAPLRPCVKQEKQMTKDH
jgi:hypothetical protein